MTNTNTLRNRTQFYKEQRDACTSRALRAQTAGWLSRAVEWWRLAKLFHAGVLSGEKIPYKDVKFRD